MKGFKHYFQLIIAVLITPKCWNIPIGVVWAQMFHETGGFTSNIYRENKNLFGMKVSSSGAKGTNYEIGENRGHAVYGSYFNSIRDYLGRQIYFAQRGHSNLIDADHYSLFLDALIKSNYAEDNLYAEKVEQLYKENKGKLLVYSLIINIIVFGPILTTIIVIYKNRKK